MSDFTSQSNVLNLAPKANTTKSVKTNSQKADSNNQAELSNTGENNQTESFLANLIQAIDETNEFLPERLQISEKEIVQEFMFKIEKGNLFGDFADEQKTSIFESLSFMQVLGVLENLQVQNTDIKLANLSSQMQQFLQTQNNLDALKDAKSLNELLNIAKSLNLEVSNIKIDRLADLKSTFPNLNKANFFANTIESVFKDFLNNKIAHIIKESGVSKENATNSKGKTTSKDNSTLLSKTLQSITSKVNDEKKDDKSTATSAKNEVKNLLDKDIQSVETFKAKNTEIPNKEKETETIIIKDEKKDDKSVKQEKTTPTMEAKEVKKDEVKVEVKKEEKIVQNEPTKEKHLTKDEKITTSNENKIEVKKDEPKNIISQNVKKEPQSTNVETKREVLTKEPKITEPKENKEVKLNEKELKTAEKIITEDKKESKIVEPNKELKTSAKEVKQQDLSKTKTADLSEAKNSFTQEVKLENISKELKVESSKEPINTNSTNTEANKNFDALLARVQNKALNSNSNESSQSFSEQNQHKEAQSTKEFNQNSSIKEDNTELNSLIKDLSQVSRSELKTQVNLKETFTQFSQDLKEQMSNYKPPITRFNLTLNPSNLGEVEVTLIQRGSNLHISFNSNTNTMNLFIQNQAEFKNSLVNMGFTGLEMNFSDQSKKDRQQQGKNRSGYGFKEEFENPNSNNSSLEVILAKYF